MVGAAGSPQVTITLAPPSLVPAEAEPSVSTVSWSSRRRMVWRHVSAVGGGSVGASLPSGNTFHCPLTAQGHSRSVWRASLEDKASGNLLLLELSYVIKQIVLSGEIIIIPHTHRFNLFAYSI